MKKKPYINNRYPTIIRIKRKSSMMNKLEDNFSIYNSKRAKTN